VLPVAVANGPYRLNDAVPVGLLASTSVTVSVNDATAMPGVAVCGRKSVEMVGSAKAGSQTP
jgi:hypothetical protein